MRRRFGELGVGERVTLQRRQRFGRKARAVEQSLDRRHVVPALQRQHAEQIRARRRFAHHKGARRLPAQRVIDEAAIAARSEEPRSGA
jgi:hypothetical protein